MRHTDIRVGDLLALRKDNPYGLPPLAVRVTDLRYRDGYKVRQDVGAVDLVPAAIGKRVIVADPKGLNGVRYVGETGS